jgi:hypothetical protein
MEKRINNVGDLQEVLDQIKFNPSCVNLDWQWDVRRFFLWGPVSEKAFIGDFVESGWHIRTGFLRPDTDTGEMGRGYGRWEVIEKGAFESTVVKTCWVLAEMIVKHELMEAFTYKGVRIFDPHRSVWELSLPDIVKNLKEPELFHKTLPTKG